MRKEEERRKGRVGGEGGRTRGGREVGGKGKGRSVLSVDPIDPICLADGMEDGWAIFCELNLFRETMHHCLGPTIPSAEREVRTVFDGKRGVEECT
jgi:hypothetical protein